MQSNQELKASVSRPITPEHTEIALKIYRLRNPSYLWLLDASAERAANLGLIVVNENAEGKMEWNQLESKMSHFRL